MQDADLFMELAAIAGVFVGFGALIATRDGGPADVVEVGSIGYVVLLAIDVVAVALAPVVLSRFDLTGHGLWLVCGIVALVLFWGGIAAVERLPGQQRAYREARPPLRARAQLELAGVAFWLPATVALVLVVLGGLPDQEAALYFAAMVLLLLMDAFFLLTIVFRVGIATGVEPRPEEARSAPGSSA